MPGVGKSGVFMITSVKFQSENYVEISFEALLKKLSYDESCLSGDFLTNLSDSVLQKTKLIFEYTLTHLKKRYFQEHVITHNEIVQNNFLEILLIFEEIFLSDDPSFTLKKCIEILDMLSFLGGARSVLVGNSLDFMISLSFFLKKHEVL